MPPNSSVREGQWKRCGQSSGARKPPGLPLQTGNSELIRAIHRAYAAKFRAIREQIEQLAALFGEDALSGIEQALSPWREKKNAFDAEYETAKSKATSNRQQLDQIQTIEKGIAEQRRSQTTSHRTLQEVAEAASHYAALRKQWNDAHARKLTRSKLSVQRFPHYRTASFERRCETVLTSQRSSRN